MLTGKVAVITGASRGIGRATAIELAKRGAFVIVNYRGSEAAALETVAEIKSAGGDAVCMAWDVSDYAECEKNIKQIIDTFGRIDILVNNAGICVLEDFLSADSFENRDKHFDINIKGVWNTTKAVLPSMFKTGAGAIVIMSSVTGDMVADPGEVAYATSKAALVGFTKAMAREVADKKIRVNAICPGYVLTPLVEGMAKQSDPEDPKRAIQAIADAVPLGRLADPTEIGELAAFLGSSESSYITGAQIVIDGGSTLPETTSMGQ